MDLLLVSPEPMMSPAMYCKFFLKKYLFFIFCVFMYMAILSTYVSMYHMHSRYLQSLEEDVVFSETGITDD